MRFRIITDSDKSNLEAPPLQLSPPLPDGGRAMGEGTGVRFRTGGRAMGMVRFRAAGARWAGWPRLSTFNPCHGSITPLHPESKLERRTGSLEVLKDAHP